MESRAISLDNLMIAANCNTVVNVLSFNATSKLIVYAAANSVLVMDPYHIEGSVPKVLFSLRGHSDRVNSVQWLSDRSLVSISSDKSIIIWAHEQGADPRNPASWAFKKVFENAHSDCINYLRTYEHPSGELYFVTMCSGGTLRLYQGLTPEALTYRD
jgi:WD40 repeat protein